jgi:hypothetical protein
MYRTTTLLAVLLATILAHQALAASSILVLREASGHLLLITETVIYSDGTVSRETTDYYKDADSFIRRTAWHLSPSALTEVNSLLPQIMGLSEHVSEEGALRLDPATRTFEFTFEGRLCYSSFESYLDESLVTGQAEHFTNLWRKVSDLVNAQEVP